MNAELIAAVASAIVAVASLAWGIHESLEKRRRERRIEDLQREIHSMEITEKRFKHRPRLDMCYLETDLGGLLSYGVGIETYLRVPNLDRNQSRAAILEWGRAVPRQLPFEVSLTVIHNRGLEELEEFLASKENENVVDHQLWFLLV